MWKRSLPKYDDGGFLLDVKIRCMLSLSPLAVNKVSEGGVNTLICPLHEC